MRESFLKLNGKTVAVSGPVSQVSHSIISGLSEQGADVGLITAGDIRQAQRFAENLNDAREIHHSYGRVVAIPSPMNSQDACAEAISRVAETLGSIDALIDTHLLGVSEQDQEVEDLTAIPIGMAQATLPYLEGRKRGRIVLFENQFFSKELKKKSSSATLTSFVSKMAHEIIENNVTANVISTGITEEYLLNKYQNRLSIKDALEEIKKSYPHARLVDSLEISSIAIFLTSPLSSGLNGQSLVLDGGSL